MARVRVCVRCNCCGDIIRADRVGSHRSRCDPTSTFTPLQHCESCSTLHELPIVRGDRSYCVSVTKGSRTTVADNLSNALERLNAHERSKRQKISNDDDSLIGEEEEEDEDGTDFWNRLLSDSADPAFSVEDVSDDEVSVFSAHSSKKQRMPEVFKHVGLNGKEYCYDSEKIDTRGFLPAVSIELPLPPQFNLPSVDKIGMNPVELELMVFIHEHNLPPSLYDGIMKWARKSHESGYCFGSRTQQTLKRQLDSALPSSLHGGDILSKKFDAGRPDDAPITLWYFDPIQLIARAMRDPFVMKDFICFPQMKRTNCGTRIYDDFVSADAFHRAFANSPASTPDGNCLEPGSLFVFLAEFDDSSCTTALMKKSEHPFMLTMMNLSLEARKRFESWFLVSFLPDIEVSDLEKSTKNQKANGDLAHRRLKLYHEMTSFLLAPFKDVNKFYNIWVHGLGWTKVYFQVGLIIGDTEQQNRICGFRGGNGMYRKHTCRDCNSLTCNSDNPNIICERTKVKDKKCFLEWVLELEKNSPGGKMMNLDPRYETSQSHKNYATADDWCRVMSQCPVRPALFDHEFGGDEEGVFGSCPFELLHQFLLGLIKYILVVMFNYRTIPPKFRAWLSKRDNPDFPPPRENKGTQRQSPDIDDDESNMDEEDDDEDDDDEVEEDEDALTAEEDLNDMDEDELEDLSNLSSEDVLNRSELRKHLDWLKTRPKCGDSIKKSNRLFSRVYCEKAARFINQFLQRQSDRNIPGLSYRAGLTAVSKMSGQELPGLCLLTIFSMDGMFGKNQGNLENDFTLLLWLCIAMNDTLSMFRFTEDCLTILQSRVVRFLTVTKALIGDQREYVSSVGLRIAKFHALLHYAAYIRKFGSPQNYFGGYLESFLKNVLKYPSKRVNGHLHRHRYDLLMRSLEGRQFALAKQILFRPGYKSSLDDAEEEHGSQASRDVSTSSAGTTSSGYISLKCASDVVISKSSMFTVIRDNVGSWVVTNINSRNPVDPPQFRNDGSDYFKLYHPGQSQDKKSVKDIVHSAIRRADDDSNEGGPVKSVVKVDFFYQVKVKCRPGEKNIILRCNPKWNEGSCNSESTPWYDWIEVAWTDNADRQYVVPAILRLWGNVTYSDDTTQLLASVRSLRSTSELSNHDRMFFARGDIMQEGDRSYCVVDFESIKSTGFVVPAIPPTRRQGLRTPSESLQCLETSDYYVALPSRECWKDVGWDRKLSSEK